ncbi:hypothetical protein JAAARDRAFT_53681 [Jaapia argillacea MUCL 33604]|uniref:RNA exonuclease 4 n=1 Tax=Jaapia argillacea MUCL 33604 TaxID=933084 RepID=A0A067Q8W3_9AGAM|nr:hypothetical protein JAAARDRAFT_53681 [Jaapia argillacea MUCL 33604]
MSQKITNPDVQVIAIATSNVGVGPGGSTSMLARVAIVNYRGQVVLDTFVAPTMAITDYRTATTGIQATDLEGAPKFSAIQTQIAQLLHGRTLVGHTLWNDLSVLGIPHPAVATRDVALYQPFRNSLRVQGGGTNQIIGLKTLMWHFMRRRCGDETMCPLENARAAMDLYRSTASDWEPAVSAGNWPCALPPSTFSRCYN